MAAVTREADVTAGAPHFGADKLGRAFRDNPGKITTWRAGQRRVFHQARDILDVARINARRMQLNDNFAALRMRPFHLLNLQLVRWPEPIEAKRAHA